MIRAKIFSQPASAFFFQYFSSVLCQKFKMTAENLNMFEN